MSSGHKVARVAMAAGAPVIKFGQFIGQATVAIAAGDHVHTHNCVFANPDDPVLFFVGLNQSVAPDLSNLKTILSSGFSVTLAPFSSANFPLLRTITESFSPTSI